MNSHSETDEFACCLSGEGDALDPGNESEKGQNSAQGVARRVGTCSKESSKAPLDIWEGGDEVRKGDGAQGIQRIGGQHAGVGPHTSLPCLSRTAGTFSCKNISTSNEKSQSPCTQASHVTLLVYNLVSWTLDL